MHPVKNMMMMENKLEVHKDKTLREATEIAYKVRSSLRSWDHHCSIFSTTAVYLQSYLLTCMQSVGLVLADALVCQGSLKDSRSQSITLAVA